MSARKEAKKTTTKKAKAEATVKVGDVIERTYKGKQLRVKVTKDGFKFRGKAYRSLTAIALEVTGARSISGPYFFRNAKRKAKGKVQ